MKMINMTLTSLFILLITATSGFAGIIYIADYSSEAKTFPLRNVSLWNDQANSGKTDWAKTLDLSQVQGPSGIITMTLTGIIKSSDNPMVVFTAYSDDQFASGAYKNLPSGTFHPFQERFSIPYKSGGIYSLSADAGWAYATLSWQVTGLILENSSVKTNVGKTPIPGAVWLLGSGLMGLVGLRKKFTT